MLFIYLSSGDQNYRDTILISDHWDDLAKCLYPSRKRSANRVEFSIVSLEFLRATSGYALGIFGVCAVGIRAGVTLSAREHYKPYSTDKGNENDQEKPAALSHIVQSSN
jgi:hypothetical protein